MQVQISDFQDYENYFKKAVRGTSLVLDRIANEDIMPFTHCQHCGLETERRTYYGSECAGCAKKRGRHARSARVDNAEINDHHATEWGKAMRG